MGTPMGAPMGAPAQGPAARLPAEMRWWLGLRGVLAILFGFVLWTWPAMSLHILVMVFGIFAIAAGVFSTLAGVRAEDTRHRWLHIGEGMLAVLAGIVALAWPAITAVALLYLIAIWAIATGIAEIGGAFRTGRAAMQEWLLILSGVVSIIFGILLMVWPGLGLLGLIWLIGIYAVVHGIILLVHAFTGRVPVGYGLGYTAGYGRGYGAEAPGGTPRAPA
jgi:uncharacterized membrane protein HdeD (DUF308 family)